MEKFQKSAHKKKVYLCSKGTHALNNAWSRPQELEEGPCRETYILVPFIIVIKAQPQILEKLL